MAGRKPSRKERKVMRLRTGVYECEGERVEVCDLISFFAIYRKNGGSKKLAIRSALALSLRNHRRKP